MSLKRWRAAAFVLVGIGSSSCQVTPQPTWSPSSEGSRVEERRPAATPTPPSVARSRSGSQSPMSRRVTPQGGPRTIAFEQDGEVYTVGWVYLPRTARAYEVLRLTSKIPGTVQVEMIWDRTVDDFALEVEDSSGSMVKATRTGQKE